MPSQKAKQKAEKKHSKHLQRVSHTFSTHMQTKMIKNKLVKVELTSIITSTLVANNISDFSNHHDENSICVLENDWLLSAHNF